PSPRRGRRFPPGVVAAFAERLDGFAATISTDFNILALGRRPAAMARAVNRLLDLHGGIVLVCGEPVVLELAAPLRGILAPPATRLLDLHGGIGLVDGERVVWELALPLGGIMTAGPLEEVAGREDELRRLPPRRGSPPHEPLYTLFFLAADFLPVVRLSPRGVWDVKRSQILLPARPRV